MGYITMFKQIKEIIEIFEEQEPKSKGTKASAAPSNFFIVRDHCPKLSKNLSVGFHRVVAKTLFTTKRARPDSGTSLLFLTTRVKQPDEDNCSKLGHLVKYFRGNKELHLILGANETGVLKWTIDGSHGVHPSIQVHTGGGLCMGRGYPISTSTKQKLNTRSSTESEIMGVSDCMPFFFLTWLFLEAQDYDVTDNIIYQDNNSAILLDKNGKASSGKRTKHINMRYFFMTDRIQIREVSVEWCPTGNMTGDFLTKPNQGSLYKRFRDVIMGVVEQPDPGPGKSKVSMKKGVMLFFHQVI